MLTGLAQLALWAVPAVLLGLTIAAGALLVLGRQRRCPSCREPMARVDDHGGAAESGERPSYEVLVCERCANAATLVHGQRARFAYCPTCHNRALRAPAIRHPDGSTRVHEHCELCGYRRERQLTLPEPRPALGRVIPFPVERARGPKAADDG